MKTLTIALIRQPDNATAIAMRLALRNVYNVYAADFDEDLCIFAVDPHTPHPPGTIYNHGAAGHGPG